MNILLGFRVDFRKNEPVETYSRCFQRELELRGHTVHPFGDGHEVQLPTQYDWKAYDLMLELDCGRSSSGWYGFHQPEYQLSIPTAIWFIDSHGHPSLHKRIAGSYDHVFFAVWSRRELFTGHKSAHWSPCATDLSYFGYKNFPSIDPYFDFGFFGSKGGLDRADPLKDICEKNRWSYDIRAVGKPYRHRWPMTAQAMRACRFAYNCGQKHDAPNQRVMESMATCRPLVTENDPLTGMGKLFEDGKHYIGYEAYTYVGLEEACKWMMDHEEEAKQIALNAYAEVRDNHTVGNRVDQILEVVQCSER